MSDPRFQAFLDALMVHGLEHFRKFYGIYRGEVIKNEDPDKRGRIQAKVPAVGHQEAPDVWIDPSFDGAGASHGAFWPPAVGDSVRVAFENGDPSRPAIYWGGWYGSGEVPAGLGYTAGLAPDARGWVTPIAKHKILLKEALGGEAIEIWFKDGASKILMSMDGSIELKAQNGAAIKLDSTAQNIDIKDAAGAEVKLDPAMVTVKSNAVVNIEGPATVNVKGGMVNLGMAPSFSPVLYELILPWLQAHIHGCAVGPTTPPLVPVPPAMSATVKVSP